MNEEQQKRDQEIREIMAKDVEKQNASRAAREKLLKPVAKDREEDLKRGNSGLQ